MGPEDSRMRRLLWYRGLTGFLNITFYFMALVFVPAVADVVVLNFTSPVFVAIFAYIFLDEPFRRADVISTLFCMIGMILVIRPPFLGFPSSSDDSHANGNDGMILFGMFCSVIAAVLLGPVTILIRKLGSAVHAQVIVLYFSYFCFFGGLLGALIEVAAIEDPKKIESIDVLYLFLVGLLGNLSVTLLQIAMREGRINTVFRMNYIQIVMSFLVGSLIFHQPFSWLSLLGAFFISLVTITQIVQSIAKSYQRR